ncbi:hypothetical protein EDD34_2040 [Myceligenerans xiligouense]|uniref:LGFP repeat-containing protein n=2 Tax=Myceligenerans xiligouense TaxID=253184 RepID=A0A3N4YL26_9MICO|nr:hypothetical protein EDD34_2040 [Myceligenerans xiligouense]
MFLVACGSVVLLGSAGVVGPSAAAQSLTAARPPATAPSAGLAERAFSSAATPADLARRWAPIHRQDVDQTGSHALGGRSDYITRVDFDGDWNGTNNWDNTGSGSLDAYAYWSSVETETHWFLTYMFFHPRDWTDSFFDTEHENDAEGVLFAVEKDGSPYGKLRAAVTVAHTDFYSYLPAGSTWSGGGESVDGTLPMATNPHDGASHPVTAQEAKGHGLKARGGYDIVGDGVVYHPAATGETPEHPDDRDVRYGLIDIFEPGGLWDRRDGAPFASWGTFAGNSSGGCGDWAIGCSTNAANAPWGWDDGDDVPGRGELATDPARVMAEYFTIPGDFSRTYVSNRYR